MQRNISGPDRNAARLGCVGGAILAAGSAEQEGWRHVETPEWEGDARRESVINLPTIRLIDAAVGIGKCSGRTIDKFDRVGLTAAPATMVKAPLIEECHASFECRLADDRLIKRHNFFIFEVVKAHVALAPKHPKTIHYTGDGIFMTSGKIVSRRALFRPERLS